MTIVTIELPEIRKPEFIECTVCKTLVKERCVLRHIPIEGLPEEYVFSMDEATFEDLLRKFKAPNSKHKIPSKFQVPVIKSCFGLRLKV